jgi:hypothetical protein
LTNLLLLVIAASSGSGQILPPQSRAFGNSYAR